MEDVRLLSNVTPIFCKLTNHLRGIEDEACIGRRSPTSLFAYLYQDLEELSRALEEYTLKQSESNGVSKVTCSEPAVTRLLELMEDSSSRTLEPIGYASDGLRYPRLRGLLQRKIRTVNGFSQKVNLQTKSSNGIRRVREMVSAARDCVKLFQGSLGQSITSELQRLSPVVSSEIRRPLVADSRIREYVGMLHSRLLAHWRCSCETQHRAVGLQLATSGCACDISDTQCQCRLARFDLLLSHTASDDLATSEPVWLSSLIYVTNNKSDDGLGNECEWEQVRSVCLLLQEASQTHQHLCLRIEDEDLWYRYLPPVTEADTKSSTRTLASIIEDRDTFRTLAKRKERFILAVLLARGLLNLQDGPWPVNLSNMQCISFRQPQDSDWPDLRTPYVKSSFIPPMARGNLGVHPTETIRALGYLLFSLELGRPIDLDNFDGAEEEIEDDIGNSWTPYFQAAYACIKLNFRTPVGDCTFLHTNFIEELYRLVVSPLEKTLYESFPDLRRSKNPPPRHTEKAVKLKVRVNIPKTDEESGPTQAPGIESIGRSCLQESTNKLVDTDLGEAQEADNWVNTLKNEIHTRLLLNRNTARRIRIAVLDTGLQLSKKAKVTFSKRLPVCRSWLEPTYFPNGDLNSGYIDTDGHGTHATGLLLTTAPYADVFVARVFESRHEKQGAGISQIIGQRIAHAIRYAVDTWQVDIISMSFGFDKEIASIDDAIRHAYSRQVLMLAAASNYGGNCRLPWPADHSLVIGIHASTGNGNRYALNTTPKEDASNFSILGVAVQSLWPTTLKESQRSGYIRKSGTSCATPIAAGVAATVMHITWQPERIEKVPDATLKELRRKLGTAAGMSKIFRQMVINKRDGYDYLVPWQFLKATHRHPTTLIDIMCDVLDCD